jgi:hypothetical protein
MVKIVDVRGDVLLVEVESGSVQEVRSGESPRG